MQAPLVEPDTEPSPALEPTREQQGWWHQETLASPYRRNRVVYPGHIPVADRTQEGAGFLAASYPLPLLTAMECCA
jgi:hypothetical protein